MDEYFEHTKKFNYSENVSIETELTEEAHSYKLCVVQSARWRHRIPKMHKYSRQMMNSPTRTRYACKFDE